MLFHAKGWTAVVLLSLALGIGANTAIFSAINGLLIKQIPVEDPETLVRLRWGGRNDMVTNSSDYGFSARGPDGLNTRATFSYPMYQQFAADNRTMSDLLACAPYGRVNVVVEGQAELATAFLSTGNYYRMLGVTARLGRTILPEDDSPSAPPVAVISSKYWHTRFTTDPEVVGRTMRINNVVVTIVGVIAPTFTGIQQPIRELHDIGFPLSLDAQLTTATGPPSRWSVSADAAQPSSRGRGVHPQNLMLFRVQPNLNRYDDTRTHALYAQLLERIAAVPGVRAAALTNPALLSGGVNSTSIFVRGRVYD